MSAPFTGWYFNGEDLQPQTVTLTPVVAGLEVNAEGYPRLISETDIRVSDRLGTVPRYLYLPGGHTIETPDNDAVDAWLAGQERGRLIALIHWLELRSRIAAVATVLLVTSVVASIWWALPVLARKIAMAVPDRVEQQAGRVALAAFNRMLLPSNLEEEPKRRLMAQFMRLSQIRSMADQQTTTLEFRSMNGRFPNAFALPGGTVILSDELVRLADTDEEIAAVVAHELGHVHYHHGIQGVLRQSAALLVVSAVTGDLSTLTTFAGTIPFMLLQRGYSREFEEEADAYAMELLRKANIDVTYFAVILKKLQESRPETGVDYSYLSTHPSTADRIRKFDPTGQAAERLVRQASLGPGRLVAPHSAAFETTDMARDLQPGDIRPRTLFQTQPVYPAVMAEHSLEGSVTVEFIIDRNGDVQSPVVVQSAYKEFEAPAVAAVLQWKFTPGQRRGRKVNVRASQVIEFHLDDLPVANTVDPFSPKSFPAKPPKP